MPERNAADTVRRGTKHIHIGAGAFGLGMVTEICQQAGFETTVLSRSSVREYHQLLKRQGNYQVLFDDKAKTRKTLSPEIYYYEGDNDSTAVDLLASSSVELITTSVKKDNLQTIAPLLRHALQKRMVNGHSEPLCILACENFQHNSAELRKLIESQIDKKACRDILRGVYFCNTLVDRVCGTISCREGKVEILAEKFHCWVVDDPGVNIKILDSLSTNKLIRLVNDLEFNGLEVQKYWCMNGAHLAAAAYAFNYDPNLRHFHSALDVPSISQKIEALQEELGLAFFLYTARKGLRERFSESEIVKYNKNVYARLAKNRTDTIARVLKQEGTVESGVVEVLNRMERLLEPQCEILAHRKRLVDPKYEAIALHNTSRRISRLELDDAITQVVFAMKNFSSHYVN